MPGGDQGLPLQERPHLLRPQMERYFQQAHLDANQSFTTIQTNEPNSPAKQDRLTRANHLAEMNGGIRDAFVEHADQPIPAHLLVAHQAVTDAFTGRMAAGDGQIKVNELFNALDTVRNIVADLPQARPWGVSEGQQAEHTVDSFLRSQLEALTGAGNLKLVRAFYEALQHTFQGLENRVISPVLRAAITTVGRDVLSGDLPNLRFALNAFVALATSGTEASRRIKAQSKS